MSTLPVSLTVREARDRYLAENGLTLDAYTAPTFEIDLRDLGGGVWRLLNIPARKRAIPLHDLHHVVTGYGTDLVGEGEIGAWELIGGCNSLFLWWINLGALLVGFLLAPRRVARAAWRARGQRTLYRDSDPYECLLRMTVADIRARLGVPVEGQADQPPRRHRGAPPAVSGSAE